MTEEAIRSYLTCALAEAVDVRRYERHATFVTVDLLMDRLSPQSYRPEILAARRDLTTRHECNPLQDLCRKKIRQGTTPAYGFDGPVCLKPQHVRPLLIDTETASRVSAQFSVKNANAAITTETVLINRSGATTIGRAGVYLKPEEAFISEHIFACSPKPSTDSAFLAAYLNSWWGKRSLEMGIAGSTGQLQLAQSHVASLPIPVIHLDLQRAIGQKIRKAERLQEMAKIAKLSITTTLNELLPGITDLPSDFVSWPTSNYLTARLDASYYQRRFLELENRLRRSCRIRRLDDYIRRARNGLDLRSFVEDGTPYLRVGDIDPYDSDPALAAKVTFTLGNVPETQRLRMGDLLITRKGRFGTVAVVDEVLAATISSSEVIQIQLEPSVSPYCLAAFLNSQHGRMQMERGASGTTMQGLTRDALRSVLVPEFNENDALSLGKSMKFAIECGRESRSLVDTAKSDIESLIEATLDERRLLEQGERIGAWLDANPLAHEKSERVTLCQ